MYLKKNIDEPFTTEDIGYSFFFENIVIFGDVHDLCRMLNQRKAKRYGEYLGTVKSVIPRDKSRILYQWLRFDKKLHKRFLERQFYRRMANRKSVHERESLRIIKKNDNDKEITDYFGNTGSLIVNKKNSPKYYGKMYIWEIKRIAKENKKVSDYF